MAAGHSFKDALQRRYAGLNSFRNLWRSTPERRTQRRRSRYARVTRTGLWAGGILLGLLCLAIIGAFLVDEPLRRRMENNLNRSLKGYSVRIGRLDFHPIGLSLDLEDLIISQNEQPDPPVANIPTLSASVHWGALLHGDLVADFEIERPKVYINRRQAKREIEDETPMKERGWQQALQEIYPLHINEFIITDGDLTYADDGPFRPLHLTRVNALAENIRNVRSERGTYPSGVHVDAIVFGKGKAVLDGHADFLAEPHVALKTDVQFDNIELDYFRPIIERYNFSVKRGTLSAAGSVEYASHVKNIDIPKLVVNNVDAEYVNKSAEPVDKKVGRKVEETAEEHSDSPTLAVRVGEVHMAKAKVGLTNAAQDPPYRLFIEETDLKISNLTNQSAEGTTVANLKGKFMGSGDAEAKFESRQKSKGPDFDLNVRIENTDMRAMNDLFRSYANFDVVAGVFSLYSEILVRNGFVKGYVKPIFKDMNVLDLRQDQEKGLLRKLYEGVIGGLSVLLQNTPRDEVATVVTISGKLSDPETSTWETIVGLVQNAFFRAILPGLERETATGKPGRPRNGSTTAPGGT